MILQKSDYLFLKRVFYFRYGWFIPQKTAEESSHLVTHWRVLQDRAKISIFEPTVAQYSFVRNTAKHTNVG